MAFTTRFPTFPAIDRLTEIEGVVIIDLPPPAAVFGDQVGFAAVAGETIKGRYNELVAITSTGIMRSEFGLFGRCQSADGEGIDWRGDVWTAIRGLRPSMLPARDSKLVTGPAVCTAR